MRTIGKLIAVGALGAGIAVTGATVANAAAGSPQFSASYYSSGSGADEQSAVNTALNEGAVQARQAGWDLSRCNQQWTSTPAKDYDGNILSWSANATTACTPPIGTVGY